MIISDKKIRHFDDCALINNDDMEVLGCDNEDDAMGPLQLAVTWYKIRHAGEQAVHWDIQNKATSSRQICIFFVVDVPVRSLLSSMVDFVPCDR